LGPCVPPITLYIGAINELAEVKLEKIFLSFVKEKNLLLN